MILSVCANPNTLKVFKIVRIVINIIKIIVPIALIISVMINLMGEVTNKNENLSEVSSLIAKKIIAAIAIFLIPTTIGIIVKLNNFNPNSYLSCLENSTDTKIQELQIDYTRRLIDDSKSNFNNSIYNMLKSEVDKIKDNTIKNQYLSEIDTLRTDFENNRQQQEEEINANAQKESKPSNESNNQKINAYMVEAYKIANDNSHGYCNDFNYCSQGNQLPDVDCGTFISYSLHYAGILPSNTFIDPNDTIEANNLLKNYGFVMHNYKGADNLQYGDLLHSAGHMVIYAGKKDGVHKIVGAHGFQDHPEPGDQNGKEVCEKDYIEHDWKVYFRLEK